MGRCTIDLACRASRAAVVCLALGVGTTTLSGCVDDPNCGICDPHNLVLQTIAGVNYASRKVRLLNPICEGPSCPEPLDEGEYFVEKIGPCEETEEAQESSRGPEEYCKLSPLVTAFGIEFIFNNLLEATSVELVRRRPDNPNLYEVYDWKTQVLEIQGPITRYNGDYFAGGPGQPDIVTRSVNLTCIRNLRDRGQEYGHDDHEDPTTDPCNRVDPNTARPLKMRLEGTLTSSRGLWDHRALARAAAHGCDNPEDGPDTCCNQCDYILSQEVAKYGLDSVGDPASPNRDTAILCDPAGDKLIQCRDFVVSTDREDETKSYSYEWCPPGTPCTIEHRVPYYDRLRETHPDERPAGFERRVAKCSSTAQCRDPLRHNLPGTECVGTNAAGRACTVGSDDPQCASGACVAPWFVECTANADTTGGQGYCVDSRYSDAGAAACLTATNQFPVEDPETGAVRTAAPQSKLAYCDANEDGRYDADECCLEELGGDPEGCDPFFQTNLRPLARYERNVNLPEQTRDCICGTSDPACEDIPRSLCEGREGEYAIQFVTRRGGVIYDPAIKGMEWRAADSGAIPRAAIEACAEQRRRIAPRTIEDGWRAHDDFDQEAESFEDYDRGMCSGQTYRVVFNTPADGAVEMVEDKLGNTLEGKAEYFFETPQFHVVPGSGFPTDNLRIGACEDLSIKFSNKYDTSPFNLRKIQLFRVGDDGQLVSKRPECDIMADADGDGEPERYARAVAGGHGCAQIEEEAAQDGGCRPPCLTADVSNQTIGELGVQIDSAEFGAILQTERTYRLVVPGLGTPEQITDPARYEAAFWDVCGMPLVTGGFVGEPDFLYEFTIDEPKCKEDPDRDQVQLSCDNARDYFNPSQGDMDRDGVGDVVDLCPTVVTAKTNSGDSDDDGIGNECDNCRQTTKQYNQDAMDLAAYMRVRNIPHQRDSDGDGIGDVCDNCVLAANCEAYDAVAPWSPGDPIAFDNPDVCQRDDNGDLIGDSCEGAQGLLAAGPVGLEDTDDFDQDGIVNVTDACPRQPLIDRIECESAEACPPNRACEKAPQNGLGVCDHDDDDGDGIGNICDTCPLVENPMQVVEGSMQEDDEDGDFVGAVCETNAACHDRTDARPMGFYEVSVNGLCCATQLVEADDGTLMQWIDDGGRVLEIALEDPDGLPVTLDCPEPDDGSIPADERTCRRLPNHVASLPGIFALPPGCDDALSDAGYASPQDNPRLTPADVDSDLSRLWDYLCLLPQRDQDFDGIGDECDLCVFDYDPENLQFVDENGKLWPGAGKFCNGAYGLDRRSCGDSPGTESDTDAEGTDTGTASSTGGNETGTGSGTGTGT